MAEYLGSAKKETVIRKPSPEESTKPATEATLRESKDESNLEQAAIPKLVSYDVNESPKLVSYDVNESEDDDAMDIDLAVGYEETSNKPDRSVVASSAKEHFRILSNGQEVRLPPEPPGKCSGELQAKIAKIHEQMIIRGSGANISQILTKKQYRDFRNPSIYENLIHSYNIDEKGTNYPPQQYNFSPESFYDHLATVQNEEMGKLEKQWKEKTKVEFVTTTKKAGISGSEVQSRHSKWDARPKDGTSTAKAKVSVVGIATNPTIVSVTSAPSGTKTTVISASGRLKKERKDKTRH